MMFFPSPFAWKMVKDASNHIPENMIGYAQTSREIHEDIISLYYRQFELLRPIWYKNRHAPVLSWYQMICLLRGCYYNINITKGSVPECYIWTETQGGMKQQNIQPQN